MRERSTWTLEEVVKKASAAKKAAEKPGDVYTMNQDHPQPAFDAYVTGDPSDFAEDVHSPNEWEKEYSGDAVKRNEIGMPEMRPETFSHSEKTASREKMLKKADLCVEIADLMLKGKKIASDEVIEDQAVALMYLPDADLISTHARLASEEGEEDEGDQGEQQQAKQAGEIPEAFKENIEKMKAKSEDKKDDDKDQGEKKQAQQQESQQSDEDQGQQDKQAQQDKKDDEESDDKADEKPWESKQAAQDMMAQMQQMQAQLQQMMQAMGQPQQQQAPMAQEQDLDQLLAADSCGPMAESDIQMDPFMDDMGGIGEEDETLKALFASDEQEEMQVQEEEGQNKQAKTLTRTASNRTVGTRPTAGVAKIGGTSKVASNTSVDNLSSLWQSAPDVRGAFGLK